MGPSQLTWIQACIAWGVLFYYSILVSSSKFYLSSQIFSRRTWSSKGAKEVIWILNNYKCAFVEQPVAASISKPKDIGERYSTAATKVRKSEKPFAVVLLEVLISNLQTPNIEGVGSTYTHFSVRGIVSIFIRDATSHLSRSQIISKQASPTASGKSFPNIQYKTPQSKQLPAVVLNNQNTTAPRVLTSLSLNIRSTFSSQSSKSGCFGPKPKSRGCDFEYR